MYYLKELLKFIKEKNEIKDIDESVDKIMHYLNNSFMTKVGFDKYKDEFIEYVHKYSTINDDILNKYFESYDVYLKYKDIVDTTVDKIYQTYEEGDRYDNRFNVIQGRIKAELKEKLPKDDYELLTYSHAFLWGEHDFKNILEELYDHHIDFTPKEIINEIKKLYDRGVYMFEVEGAGNGFQSHTEEFLYRELINIKKKKDTNIKIVY